VTSQNDGDLKGKWRRAKNNENYGEIKKKGEEDLLFLLYLATARQVQSVYRYKKRQSIT